MLCTYHIHAFFRCTDGNLPIDIQHQLAREVADTVRNALRKDPAIRLLMLKLDSVYHAPKGKKVRREGAKELPSAEYRIPNPDVTSGT